MSDKTMCQECGMYDARMRWWMRRKDGSAVERDICPGCEDIFSDLGLLVTEVCRPLAMIAAEAERRARTNATIADLRAKLEAARETIQRGADIECALNGQGAADISKETIR